MGLLMLQESIPRNFLLDLQVFKMVSVELRKLAPHLQEISPGLPRMSWLLKSGRLDDTIERKSLCEFHISQY